MRLVFQHYMRVRDQTAEKGCIGTLNFDANKIYTYVDCSLENISVCWFCKALHREDGCTGGVVLRGDSRAQLSIQTVRNPGMA